MSLSVQIGLLLSVATAFFAVVGFLYKHRGAIQSPPVEWSHPVRTSLALFRNRWYVLGIAIAIGSWGFHVAALALAPISLVQAVIAGGLVLLTVVADKLFAHSVTRREWIGVGLAALGLAFLAATLEGSGESARSDFDAADADDLPGGGDCARRRRGCVRLADRPRRRGPRRLRGPVLGRLRHRDQGADREPSARTCSRSSSTRWCS